MSLSGIGAKGAIVVLEEETPGTSGDVADGLQLNFTQESLSSNREYATDESIQGDALEQGDVPGIQAVTGGITQNFDGATAGQMMYFAHGSTGYEVAAYYTPQGAPSAAPSAGAGLTTGVARQYRVASIWTKSSNGENLIMPRSSALGSATPSSTNLRVTLGWVNVVPDADDNPGFAFAGTAIFVKLGSGTENLLHIVTGSGTSYIDAGTGYSVVAGLTSGDPSVNSYTVDLYGHVITRESPAAGIEPVIPFTTWIFKDNDLSEKNTLCRIDTQKISASGPSAIVTMESSIMGQQETNVANFSSAQQLVDPFVGWQAVIFFDGVKDCNVKSFEFTTSNGLSMIEGLCGVDYNQDSLSGGRKCDGTFTRQFTNHNFHSKMKDGVEGAILFTTAGAPVQKAGSNTSLSLHGMKCSAFRYYFSAEFFRCTFRQAGGNIGGKGPIPETVNFKALKDLTENTDVKFILINATPSYAAA